GVRSSLAQRRHDHAATLLPRICAMAEAPSATSGGRLRRKVRWYQTGNLLHSRICSGTNSAKKMSPAIHGAQRLAGAIARTSAPADKEARAPIVSRPIII